eukprot:1759598-Rhodomonas_salina.1
MRYRPSVGSYLATRALRDVRYWHSVWCYVQYKRRVREASVALVRDTCGTDLVYGATLRHASVALAVLIWRIMLRGYDGMAYDMVVCVFYGMCGTEVGYCSTGGVGGAGERGAAAAARPTRRHTSVFVSVS